MNQSALIFTLMLQVEVIAVVVSCLTLSMAVCSEVLAGCAQTLTRLFHAQRAPDCT